MTERGRALMGRFDALSLRERGLIALTLVVLLLFLWWVLVYEALASETVRLQQANRQLSGEMTAMQALRDGIQQKMEDGVHRESRQRVEALQRELDQLRQRLEQDTGELVSPRHMFALMRQMIDAAPRLELVELRRSAVEPLMEQDRKGTGQDDQDSDATEGRPDAGPALYRHVMQVRLRGRYADILSWLQQLERLPWQLMWNRVELKAGDYPSIEVALSLSTVSSSRAWVGL